MAYGVSPINSNYMGCLTIWEDSVDVNNNTSTIKWNFKVFRSDHYNSDYDRNYANHFTLTVDGSYVSGTPYTNFRAWLGENGRYESTANIWCSGSFVVTHNSDGNKSFSFTARYWNTESGKIGTESRPLTVSDTFYCTAIPRTSSFYAPNTTLGENCHITINRSSTAFHHTLWYRIDGGEWVWITNDAYDSWDWTPTIAAIAPLTPNSSTCSCEFECNTYNGNSLVGRAYQTITLTVPNLPPSFNVSAQLVGDFYGLAIQGVTRVKFTFSNFSGQYGATLSKYTINGYDVSNPYTSIPIRTTGNVDYPCVAYDSRGYSSSRTVTIENVLAYSTPSLSNIRVFRCNASGVADDDGAYASVSAVESHTVIRDENLEDINPAEIHVQYRQVGTSTWQPTPSIALTSGVASIIGGSFDTSASYEMRFEVADSINTALGETAVFYYDVMPQSGVSISERAGNKGVGIGIPADEDNVFKVNLDWTSKFGAILSNGDSVIPVKSQSIGATQGYLVLSNGLAVCWKRVTTTIDCETAWGSMYETASDISFGNMLYTFGATPIVSATVHSGNAATIENILGTSTTSFGSAYFCRATPVTNATITVDLIAIGIATS